LLPSFDLPLLNHDEYISSKFGKSSQFNGIMDRVLLSRYLVDRFAYVSFIQFGCKRHHSIYQLLPENIVKTRICVDKQEGSIRTTPKIYLNATRSQNKKFDFIIAEAGLLEDDYLNDFLQILSDGGALIFTESNQLHFATNKTTEISVVDADYLLKFVSLRGRYDLDVATLDSDSGEV
jgi:hypothetical protein